VQLNRRTRVTFDELGVAKRFGVAPPSIPDYLALVGDSSDGYPGLPGWGAKSSAAVLAKYRHFEHIPENWREWQVSVANAGALSLTFARQREDALLFRTLATLRTDIALFEDVDTLRWTGPTPEFTAIAARFDAAIVSESKRPTGRRPLERVDQ
jgi:5'-3' exonuclease